MFRNRRMIVVTALSGVLVLGAAGLAAATTGVGPLGDSATPTSIDDGAPSSSIDDDATSTSIDDDTSSTVDDDTSSTVDDDTSSSVDDRGTPTSVDDDALIAGSNPASMPVNAESSNPKPSTRESSRRSLSCLSTPWQPRQFSTRMGRTWRSK